MALTQQDLPGAYVEFGIHANTDGKMKVTLYSEYDEATDTGTVVDLTGATFKASSIDEDGTVVWTVTPTAPTPTNGEIFIVVPKATTLAKKNTNGDWGLKVIWPDTTETIEAYGPTMIGPNLVPD